jgi:transcriptional regulator with XRE-family HTH domain
MSESFGARLRRRREDQGIALDAIAEETKIKLSLLEGLERDDVSRWPAGIFRRAYLRAYAHAIGLDPDAVVREFLDVHEEPSEDLLMAALAETTAAGRGGPPTRLRYIVGSAMESLSRFRRSQPPGDSLRHASPQPSIGGGVELDEPMDEAPAFVPDAVSGSIAAAAGGGAVPGVPDSVVSDERAEVPWAPPEAAEGLSEPAAIPPAPAEPQQAGDALVGAGTPTDFLALAQLCTEIARVATEHDLQPLLGEAARILDATGLILWVSDTRGAELVPALVHGYSDKVIAQLPRVRREADNPTAAAFRLGRTCVSKGGGRTGALVVPLPTPDGCAGVLALELQHGGEQRSDVHAAATIVAAALAQLAGGPPREEVPAQDLATAPVPGIRTAPPIRKVRR